MLSRHCERWRVMEAMRLGVNEYLKKPVSGKALLDRMVSILSNPRPMVHFGDYYGPEPRRQFPEPVRRDANNVGKDPESLLPELAATQ
jgi:two-component system, chemotaxis family, chemotaxis protein CheY